ncbi:hypothetical protein [Kitasatospora indigofera]
MLVDSVPRRGWKPRRRAAPGQDDAPHRAPDVN